MKNISLKQLGFDEKTERVYLSLLSLADATAQQIAKKAALKRTSVYHILDKLISMGLVSSYRHRGVKRFFAESPSKVKAFFDEKSILADRLIPELQKIMIETAPKTQIRIFDGSEGIKSVSDDALEAKEKLIFSIGSTTKLLELAGGKYGFGQRRRKKGIFARSLRYKTDEVINGAGRLHEVRFLPESFNFPGYIVLFDNKVAITLFEGNGFTFLVASDAFAKMMKSLFENLWQESSQ